MAPKQKPWQFTKFKGDMESIDFHLTDQSKQVFEQGKPGQGYIGLAELETGKIHLVPCFNYPKKVRKSNQTKDAAGQVLDDMEAYTAWMNDLVNVGNKRNEHFKVTTDSGKKRDKYFVSTVEHLGGMQTGKAHGGATAYTGTSRLGATAGKLIGFGIWKGSKHLIKEFRDRSSSQNRHAIQFSPEFLDAYLTEEYKVKDEEGYLTVELDRKRSLPQELGNMLLDCLLSELPLEHGMKRTLEEDVRTLSMPNPFIEAAMEGNLDEVKAFLKAGMHVNEIGTSAEITALLAAATAEDIPNRIPILIELISHPDINFDYKDADENLFYHFLENDEITKIVNTLHQTGEMQAAAKWLTWLNERDDININDLIHIDTLSDIYFQAISDDPDMGIYPLLFCIAENMSELPRKENPLYDEIMFLKCCESMKLAKDNLDQIPSLNNIDKHIVAEGIYKAFKNNNLVMCQHVLNQITPEAIAEIPNLFRNRQTGQPGMLDTVEQNLKAAPDTKMFQVAEIFRTQLREPCANLYRDIRRGCKELESSTNQLQQIQDDLDSKQIDTVAQIEEQVKQCTSLIGSYQSAVRFYSHPLFTKMKGFHAFFPVNKEYQRMITMRDNLEQKLNEVKEKSFYQPLMKSSPKP